VAHKRVVLMLVILLTQSFTIDKWVTYNNMYKAMGLMSVYYSNARLVCLPKEAGGCFEMERAKMAIPPLVIALQYTGYTKNNHHNGK
jgi:hypothetical protein